MEEVDQWFRNKFETCWWESIDILLYLEGKRIRIDEDLETTETPVARGEWNSTFVKHLTSSEARRRRKAPEGDDVFLCNKANIQVSLCGGLFRATPNEHRYCRR